MVLEKVAEYFNYWYKYRNQQNVPEMEVPVELCLELLMAADYLGLDSKINPTHRVAAQQPATSKH